jgi:hypothetical protein
MADGPWRCSACGTINEPVANSCRTCGRWPSLFDLQESVVDEVELEDLREEPVPAEEPALEPEPMPVEPAPFEPEPFEPDPMESERARRGMFDPPTTDPVLEQEGGGRRRSWVSWLLPLAFVVYLVLSIVFGDRS